MLFLSYSYGPVSAILLRQAPVRSDGHQHGNPLPFPPLFLQKQLLPLESMHITSSRPHE